MTLAYIFDHAVCCASAASSGRSLHLITSQLRKVNSSNCPNHVRRTKSSIKKRINVRRILANRERKRVPDDRSGKNMYAKMLNECQINTQTTTSTKQPPTNQKNKQTQNKQTNKQTTPTTSTTPTTTSPKWSEKTTSKQKNQAGA